MQKLWAQQKCIEGWPATKPCSCPAWAPAHLIACPFFRLLRQLHQLDEEGDLPHPGLSPFCLLNLGRLGRVLQGTGRTWVSALTNAVIQPQQHLHRHVPQARRLLVSSQQRTVG